MRLLALSTLLVLMGTTTSYAAETKTAVFAAGCFWCVESDFEGHDGVKEVTSGYAGGHVENPTYKQVSNGGTGHLEVAQVEYDPDVISYNRLLEIFWANVDPWDSQGQFCDKGESYKSAIFYTNDDEKTRAEESIAYVEGKIGKPVVTEIKELTTFYPAEDYHQDYYKKNETKYKFYRWRCGRDERLKEVWGDDAKKAIEIFAPQQGSNSTEQ